MENIKNYGNNISITICKKKYIIGNNMNISLVIIMTFIYTILLILWIILLYKLYSLYVFLLGIFLYLLMLYYYLKSFFTEPGIIPRNYPKYILNNNLNIKIKQLKENDIISYQTMENSTKNEFNLDDSPIIIKNIHNLLKENLEQKDKAKNKIFPDFILADSAEELKNSINKMDNSINGGTTEIGETIPSQNDSIFSKQNNLYINGKIVHKDISKEVLRKDNLEIKNNFTPHIYQRRPCTTCNIYRPPKASHCVICDDCIMDLDHHCFYISNCVGARNRKFFVFFLIFGFFLSFLMIFTSLYHAIFVFFIQKKNKYLTIQLFKEYYIFIIISSLVMLLGILILFIKKESLKLSIAIFTPGNILFDFFFYYNKNKNELSKKKFIDFEYHPFSICLIYAILPLILFVCKYLRKQIKLIGKGLTTKQYFSIKGEKNSNKNNREVYDYLDSILKREVNFKNVFKFLFSKNKRSLINA